MSYQGPAGAVGAKGPQGCTGQRGLQGTPYGPPGASFYNGGVLSPTGLSAFSSNASSPFTLSAANIGSYNYFYGVNDLTINASAYTPNPSTDSGAYWCFYMDFPYAGGSYTATRSITFNGNASVNGGGFVFNGTSNATTISGIPSLQTNGVPSIRFTIAYSSDPFSSTQYFIMF